MDFLKWRWRVFPLPVLVLWMSAPLHAQTAPEDLARRELITQAEQARAAGDHAHALDLATRAGEIHMTPSLRLLLATEHRAVGHAVEALSNAIECVAESRADTTLRNRARILPACEAMVAALEPQVGHLRVVVSNGAPADLHVRVGGTEVVRALWGIPYALVPGEIRVVAMAEGFRPWSMVVPVQAGQTADAVVTLEVLPPVSVPTVVAPPPQPVVESPPPWIPPPPSHTVPSEGPGAGPWVLMSVGAAGLLTAIATYALAQNQWSSLGGPTGQCPNDTCRTQALADSALASSSYGTYRAYTYATDVALSVGGVSFAAGLVWLLAAHRSNAPTSQALSFGVTPEPGGWSMHLGGAL